MKNFKNKSCPPRLKNDQNFETIGGYVDNFGTRFEKKIRMHFLHFSLNVQIVQP